MAISRVLLGLLVGLAAGALASRGDAGWLPALLAVAEPAGTLFVNAIRMTVIPLVVASLVLGVATDRVAGGVGRLGAKALALFLVTVAGAAVFAALIGFPLLGALEVGPALAESLRGSAADASPAAAGAPGLSDWFVGLVPANPFKAAADGALLPLIAFGVAFGLALGQVPSEARRALLGVLRAVADAMLVVVGWVLELAPLGVCALAVGLGARMGAGAAGALAWYMLVVSGIASAFVLLALLPAAVLLGRQPLGRFLRAIAPAAAVAFSSRSSLAALPACIDAATGGLRLPGELAGFFLPLAASMFRVGAAIAQVAGVLFLARLYGVPLGIPELATVVLSVVFTSLTAPGIPAGAIIVLAPVLSSVGVPVEGIGLLMGVDTIPDMFRTTANVVGWMAGAAVLGRSGSGPASDRGSASP